ncbi:response regulator [Nocardioides sp. zg-1228]|uniref:response regulator n=1 Tax=Nocardioides sp. zg-1228 TaxID=2763008 RepID=UPI0016427D75|nr:response regulator [Nocardioides sp. zg-1228]MBC2934150.1 response regulator [Nocardioides sp. zg-1228]QSF58895.1 response regulator [Nocardioides sp. zg-1228]
MAESAIRVLVLEDDRDAAHFMRASLSRLGGMEVDLAGTADEAVAAMRRQRYDVLVTDIRLPGRSGLQALPEFRAIDATVAVLVLTAYPTFDHAVGALREDVDDFLVKPVGAEELVSRVEELADLARRRRAPSRLRVLAVGAHPDDVELGVGATLAAHAAAGDEITTLVLSGGAVGGSTDMRHGEAVSAAALVGARLIHLDFADTHMSPADGLITAVERAVAEVAPDRIYTHGIHDRHQDHRAVHEAVEIGARSVGDLWCFQSPSSTVDFRPNRFVTVDGFVDTKLEMLAAFASQAHRDYMQPDAVRASARYWARFTTAREVEPLETVRVTQTVRVATSVQAPQAVDDPAADAAHGGCG